VRAVARETAAVAFGVRAATSGLARALEGRFFIAPA
jgi:hypothetical protein